MKTLFLLLGTALLVLAGEDSKKAPQPLTPAEHEEVSRAMLKSLGALNHFREMQLSLAQAQQEAQAAADAYRQVLADKQAKHNAAGCDLDYDKNWVCPPKK